VKLFLTKESQPKKLIGKGYMNMFKDNISFDIKDGKKTLDFSSIVAITLVGKKKMNIYCKDSTYQVVNNGKTNFLKYMHLYYILENRKEGNENGFIGI
jgi:hypothetical protein